MSRELPSWHRALFGRDHRADWEEPVPDALRDFAGRPCTDRALWLSALVAEFGVDEVARWGACRVDRLSARAAVIRVNAEVRAWRRVRAVFTAVREGSPWILRRGLAVAGRPLAACADLREAGVLAAYAAPVVPPVGSGWTFAEWGLEHGGRHVPVGG